jgi:hypothetical protein
MTQTKILLETTVQIHRVADAPQIRAKVRGELYDKELFTSSYVLREFLWTVINDIRYLHEYSPKLGLADGKATLLDIIYLLYHPPNNYSHRSAERMHLIIAEILKRYVTGATGTPLSLPTQKLLRYLEMTANHWLWEFRNVRFADGQEYYIDDNHYFRELDERTNELEEWIDQHRPIPSPPPFPAAAARLLLERNRDAVERLEQLLESAHGRDRNPAVLKMLKRLKGKDGSYAFEKLTASQASRGLGDLLIGLEGREDVAIYTTDSHFHILCGVIGRTRHEGYRPTMDDRLGGSN